MKFGDNLRKLRKLRKISQEELAEKVNVSRQSVSKWETGEAYPEMNNILELCKIFHCKINDLVNSNIIDASSLNEEVKMNVVKFKKEQQNRIKGFSKTISIISKVCKIILIVCIPIVVISMIIIGLTVSKVKVTDNEVSFNGFNESIRLVETDNKVSFMFGDVCVGNITNQDDIIRFKELFINNDKNLLLIYVETGFVFLLINIVLISIMLHALENLFTNINKGDTPFTLINVEYIKRMAYLMIVITIMPNIAGVIFERILNINLNIEFELFNLVEILFLFSIAYIFQYGYEIQLDSQGKMYGDDECE